MPIWGLFMKKVQGNSKLGYNSIDKFDKPSIMEGMDECDAVDEISLQRAAAQMSVSRSDNTYSFDVEEEISESNPFNENTENDYRKP